MVALVKLLKNCLKNLWNATLYDPPPAKGEPQSQKALSRKNAFFVFLFNPARLKNIG